MPIFNMVGGGGGKGATLVVTAPAGVNVIVSNGDKTKSTVANDSGIATVKGLETGAWTVTISNESQTASKTIAITTDYDIVMAFFAATITVTYPKGSTCTCTDGTTALTASDTTGSYTFTVPNTGIWTVSCTDGENSASNTVEITNESSTVTMTLGYAFAYTYTGDNSFSGDASGDWELKLTTGGTLTVTDPGACNGLIDIYILGGGGGGSNSNGSYNNGTALSYYGGGGGGGGYTTNIVDGSIQLAENSTLTATIGAGGSAGSAGGSSSVMIDGTTYTAAGGSAGSSRNGGKGGSGGGGGGVYASAGGAGGTNGGNGSGCTNSAYNISSSGGNGQGTSTLPFGKTNTIPYGAGGGGGGAYYSANNAHGSKGANGGSTANQGMGGKGKTYSISDATAGGSGIIIIRNHRVS